MSSNSAVIIGSARGVRRLDNTLSAPPSLAEVDSSRTVLDWTLHALGSARFAEITYVGGYHIQKVIERYPTLSYRFHPDWQQEGEVLGLLLARPDPDAGACLVVRASTVCVPEAVDLLVGTESEVRVGYYANGDEQAFAGLVALPAGAVSSALEIAEELGGRHPAANLEHLLAAIADAGLPLARVDVDGLAAPTEDRAAVWRIVFGGKGQTLNQVGPLVRTALVPEQVRFRVDDWQAGEDSVLDRVQQSFVEQAVIVRSSAQAEDGLDTSGAGVFASILDVPTADRKRLRDAIAAVVESYGAGGRAIADRDEVLVQPQVAELAASGVLLTRDLETGAPYYVLSVDRESGRSDVVTSGAASPFDTLYVSHRAELDGLPSDVQACVSLAVELQELTHLDALDIEFGIDRQGTTYLFQVRPLSAKARRFQLADEDLFDELERIREFLEMRFSPHPALAGRTTLLGTMPDWNPAEMIGTAPRPLALSLYQRLIGDEAWAAARAAIGYRDARPEPLIVSLGGRPYVDVRASLNSFLPRDLPAAVAEPWVDHCLATLRRDPRLHDKIEFEVAVTCLAFDFDDHSERMRDAGLDAATIAAFRRSLLTLTDGVLRGATAPIAEQLAQLDELARRRDRWLEPVTGTPAIARRINALFADCERYGTVPFSILARYAFIALSMLRSLEHTGVFSGEEYETILRSIPTVASALSRDLALHAAGQLPTGELLERYGHLRPSSYDIASPNYASAWETYFAAGGFSVTEPTYPDPDEALAIFARHRQTIERLLRGSAFTASAQELSDFILASIPARESAKFEFMKSVDALLEAVAELGEREGFSRSDMSFLPIDVLVRGASASPSSALGLEFRRNIEYQKKRAALTVALHLPHLVRSTSDVFAFELEEWAPNYLSSQRVVAEPIVLDDGVPAKSLEARIVLIRAADPGYDWIFGHRIAGLITEYGGVASHMAIRAAEFGLPAAIGCGELIFDRLRRARLVELDCASKRVRALA